MNFKNLLPAKLCIILIGLSLFISSCQRNGLTRSIKTSNSIQDVDEEMRKMATQIEATETSLETLVDAEAADLKNDFDDYSANLNKLNAQGKIVMKRIDEMKTKSRDYFVEWEKQENTYTNQNIRDLSEQRRNKLAKSYDEVRIKSIGIKGTYLAYSTDLNEIQSYLENDLTLNGIKTLKPVTRKASENLELLEESFEPVIEALNDIRTQLHGGNK